MIFSLLFSSEQIRRWISLSILSVLLSSRNEQEGWIKDII